MKWFGLNETITHDYKRWNDQYNIVISTLKKYNAMKDKKKLEVLLKVIRIYDKNPEMQKVMDASIIEVYAEWWIMIDNLAKNLEKQLIEVFKMKNLLVEIIRMFSFKDLIWIYKFSWKP